MSLYFLVNLLSLSASVQNSTLMKYVRNGSFETDYRVRIDQRVESPMMQTNLRQYTLARGASVTVQCISSGPISWYRGENLPWASTELVTCSETDRVSPSSGTQCASMVFTNGSVEQIGRYYCVNDAVLRRYREQHGCGTARCLVDLEADFRATSLYLFVHDLEQSELNSQETTENNIVPSGASVRLVCGISSCPGGSKATHMNLAIIPPADVHVKENDAAQRVADTDLSLNETDCGTNVFKELIIQPAKEEHSGSYRCEANWTNPDGSLHTKTIRSLQLVVMDSTEGFVFFLEDSNDTAIRIPKIQRNKGGQVKPLTITINYEAFSSNVSCSWYRDGITIEALSSNGSQQYEIRHKGKRDSLTILHPSVWDSARYAVQCSVGNGMNRNTSLDVFIEDGWEVKASTGSPTSIAPSRSFELVCRSRGVEDPQFQLYFIKCKDQRWDECRTRNDKHKLNATSISKHRTAFEVYYVSVISPEGFGIAGCDVSTLERGQLSAEILLQSFSQAAQGTLNRKDLYMFLLLAALVVLLFIGIVWSYRRCTEHPARVYNATAIDSQHLDFLPDVYRFPREKLQLFEPIGRGEFGITWKAKVSGVVDDPSLETIVAVKEALPLNDGQTMATQLAELRANVLAGHHLNVVNLLGAVVDNVCQGELMLIMEYCQFGDLKDFLQQNRAFFENSDDFGLFGVPVAAAGSVAYPFSKTDLLYWASQIACGMDYLGTSGLIHCDLAARNVLLCEGGIVKIGDYGMARVPDCDEVCRSPHNEWLPLAWMALESILEGTFSTSSDVWAYGVLLWELFTLGAEPYSMVATNESILDMLEQGYRMEKPEYASMEVYMTMRNCWESEPSVRPTFKQLHTELHTMLPVGLRQRYARLNELYVFMNTVESETETRNTPLHVYVNESVVNSIRMPQLASKAEMEIPVISQIVHQGKNTDPAVMIKESHMEIPATSPIVSSGENTDPAVLITKSQMEIPASAPIVHKGKNTDPAVLTTDSPMGIPALTPIVSYAENTDPAGMITESQMEIPATSPIVHQEEKTDPAVLVTESQMEIPATSPIVSNAENTDPAVMITESQMEIPATSLIVSTGENTDPAVMINESQIEIPATSPNVSKVENTDLTVLPIESQMEIPATAPIVHKGENTDPAVSTESQERISAVAEQMVQKDPQPL